MNGTSANSKIVCANSSGLTVAGNSASATFAQNPAYPMYGLQLVVWFGA